MSINNYFDFIDIFVEFVDILLYDIIRLQLYFIDKILLFENFACRHY